MMKKKIWALFCVGALLLAMSACSDTGSASSSSDTPGSASASESASAKASSEASADAAGNAPSAAAGAPDDGDSNELTVNKSIQNVSYKTGTGWVPIESGDTGVYGFNVGSEAACSVTVAAMPAVSLEGVEMDEKTVAETMTDALGITEPAISDAEFKGIAGAVFTGVGSESQGAEGYVVKHGDHYYVIMLLSTDTAGADVRSLWKEFQETVTFS